MNKNHELEELFQTVNQIYAKNIDFLKESHPYIYEKVRVFESLQKEDCFLEFIDNHFEIVDKNGNKTYNCNPFYDAQKRCEKLEEKPSFELIKNVKIDYGVYYTNYINAQEFINEFLELPNNSSEIKYDKFIFLGTLLGVHLNDLARVLKSFVYLICEDSIEIFRLSLFLTDYKELSKSAKLFFCIEENEIKTDLIIGEFLNYKKKYNYKIFFEIASEKSIHFIDKIKTICIDNDPYNYPFSEYLVSLKRAIYYKQNSQYGILNCSKQMNIFDRPILFLGAGPSLAENIEWVYSYQDAFIVVCAAACLKRLELLGVVPDIILSADGQLMQILKQFEVKEEFYKNSIIIASIKTDLNVANKFNMQNSFFISDNLEIFENSGLFTGVSVGDIGLDFLVRMGAKNIYMIGYDASLSKDGSSHDTIYKEGKNSKENIVVKGNFEKEVFTNYIFNQLIEQINIITSKMSKDVNIFNLSNGAYFENTTPMKKDDINFNSFCSIDKNTLQNSLKNIFVENSSDKISTKDLNMFKKELKILEKLENISINKFEQEYEKIKSSYSNSISVQIINTFFDLIKPYSEYQNSIEAKKLEFKQFLEIVQNLKDSYLLIYKEEVK